jgi:hypothetical protein
MKVNHIIYIVTQEYFFRSFCLTRRSLGTTVEITVGFEMVPLRPVLYIAMNCVYSDYMNLLERR